MSCGTQPPCCRGRIFECIGEDLARDACGREWGELPLKRERLPGWQSRLRILFMHCALSPSEPPGGVPQCRLALAAVGGARSRGDRYLSAIVRLQGFSSCSPDASPRQWSPKAVTTSSMVGRCKPGCGLCLALSFKDLHHPCWGRRSAPSGGVASAWAGASLLPSASGGGNHPPALWRRRPPAMPGKANCCCQARVQHSVLCPGDGGQPHQGVSQHVVRCEGGTRVLARSHSRFRGEDGSEDLPVRFRAAGARWCGVGGQVEVLLLGSSSEAGPGSVEGGINAEGAAAPPADARACGNSLSVACACFLRPPRPKHVIVVL
jgi:hypothetical protein